MGQVWELRITAADAIVLRSRKLVDLLGTEAAKSASAVFADPIAGIEVASAILGKQRKELGLSDDAAFLSRWDGDTLQDLLDATVEGIIDFFPSGRRELLKTVWNRQRSAAARTEQAIRERLTKPETLASLDRAADKATTEFDKALELLDQQTR